jgi:predicted transposase YbfD/YdcC
LFAVDQASHFKYANFGYKQTVNKGHGRIDVRECWSTSDPAYLRLIRGVENWSGLQSIAMVICTRIIAGQETRHIRYYISSLPSDAERLLHVVRKHWSIENQLHWVLDVALNEDRSRVCKDQAPENLAVLRHIALNLLTCACGTVQANARKRLKVASMPGNSRLVGRKTTCSRCSLQEFRCDCPGEDFPVNI